MAETTAIPEYSAKWWQQELTDFEKTVNEKWRDSARKVVARYLDDRRGSLNAENQKLYNIFWANVQILKSALYATPPKVAVQRQYMDPKDDVGRVAGMILQRCLTADLEKDDSTTHTSLQNAVEDRLIPGLGQVWLRYEVETEKYQIPPPIDPQTGVELGPPIEAERILHEEVCVEHVNWEDYAWSPARTPVEIWWQARRVWMGKKKFIKRFDQKKYDEIKEMAVSHQQVEASYPKGFRKGKVSVWEIWCEDTGRVYWVNDNYPELLDERDPPIELDNFFPCPVPLLATHTTNDMTPRPDYVMMQDQYTELDTLNARINTLTKALRVVGVYDKDGGTALTKLLDGPELAMVPVDNWAMWAEKGGMKGSVDWFPVEQIANVLDKLTQQRVAVIGQIYELSGISDIMRGASNPRETAKAQTLKAQYSSVRLQLIQQSVAKFVQQVMRLKAEIIAKHYQPETIKRISGIMFTDSAQFADAAIALIKDFEASEYRLEVNEESLSLADYNAEREMRIELATAVGQLLSQAAASVQSMPGALPYILRIIQWVIASFRGNSDIETVIDEAIAAAQQAPAQGPQQEQKPDPMADAAAKAKSQIAIDNNQAQNEQRNITSQSQANIMEKIVDGAVTMMTQESKPRADV